MDTPYILNDASVVLKVIVKEWMRKKNLKSENTVILRTIQLN